MTFLLLLILGLVLWALLTGAIGIHLAAWCLFLTDLARANKPCDAERDRGERFAAARAMRPRSPPRRR